MPSNTVWLDLPQTLTNDILGLVCKLSRGCGSASANETNLHVLCFRVWNKGTYEPWEMWSEWYHDHGGAFYYFYRVDGDVRQRFQSPPAHTPGYTTKVLARVNPNAAVCTAATTKRKERPEDDAAVVVKRARTDNAAAKRKRSPGDTAGAKRPRTDAAAASDEAEEVDAPNPFAEHGDTDDELPPSGGGPPMKIIHRKPRLGDSGGAAAKRARLGDIQKQFNLLDVAMTEPHKFQLWHDMHLVSGTIDDDIMPKYIAHLKSRGVCTKGIEHLA